MQVFITIERIIKFFFYLGGTVPLSLKVVFEEVVFVACVYVLFLRGVFVSFCFETKEQADP